MRCERYNIYLKLNEHLRRPKSEGYSISVVNGKSDSFLVLSISGLLRGYTFICFLLDGMVASLFLLLIPFRIYAGKVIKQIKNNLTKDKQN